jgi:hypothetical protein
MLDFTITLNGVKVHKSIPIKWEEVPFKDFINLNTGSELTALAMLTGIEESILAKAEISNLNKVINALSFLKTEISMMKFPKKILGYQVRQDLGFDSFGQYTDIKTESEKDLSGIDRLKSYPLLAAIYVTHPYDFKEAEKKVSEIENAPCTEVLALGNFLLVKLIALKTSTNHASQSQLTPLRRLRLAFRGWRAHLGFRVRYFIFNLFHPTERAKKSIE